MKIPEVLNRYWFLPAILGFCFFFAPATIHLHGHYMEYGLKSTLDGLYPAVKFLLWMAFSALTLLLGIYLRSRNKK